MLFYLQQRRLKMIKYGLETKATGVLINYTPKTGQYGTFALLRLKCGYEGQTQITVVLPHKYMRDVSEDDLGRPVSVSCYSNENNYGTLNHKLIGLRWLDVA